jgi:hypothetical protein
MSGTVFITNMNPEHDYTSAGKYGAIRPITSGNYAIFKTSRLVDEAVQALIESDENDYLLVSGSSVVASICMAVWLAMHKKVNLLLHDRRQTQYVPRTLLRSHVQLNIEKARDKLAKRKEGLV